MRRSALAGLLAAASLLALAGCSGSPSATHKTTTTTGGPPNTTPVPPAPLCAPSAVSAAVDFTKFGGTSSTLAGAVVFRDTSSSPCSLRGVPRVQVLGADGQTIAVYQAPAASTHTVSALLTPAAPSGTGAQAASSITFSDWTCATHTMSLSIRFTGWTGSVAAAPTATSGNNSAAPCSEQVETDQTVYLSPVISVTG